MHKSSLERCRAFISQYLSSRATLRIADVGSYDVNGTYRALFQRPGWIYTGFDVVAGPNVDEIVPADEHAVWPHADEFDVVISGQCVEHVRKPWKWIVQVASLAKPGGILWITGPNTWAFHEHPVDCWRIWPDGMRALFDEAGLQEIECAHFGKDTVGIAFKPSS